MARRRVLVSPSGQTISETDTAECPVPASDVSAVLRCLGAIDHELHASHDRDRQAESVVVAVCRQLDELSLALEAGKAKRGQRVSQDQPCEGDRTRYRELLDELDRKTDLARARRGVGQRERRTFESLRGRALSSLPPAVVSAYEVLVEAGRLPALVELSNGRCGGCGEHVVCGANGQAPVAKDIIRCPSCGRLLALTGRSRSTASGPRAMASPSGR